MNQTVTVAITSLDGTSLYSQTVEAINLRAVIDAVNTPTPAPKKARSDKGKPKPRKATPVTQPLGI